MPKYIFKEDFSKFKAGQVVDLPRALGGSLVQRKIVERTEEDLTPAEEIEQPKPSTPVAHKEGNTRKEEPKSESKKDSKKK